MICATSLGSLDILNKKQGKLKRRTPLSSDRLSSTSKYLLTRSKRSMMSQFVYELFKALALIASVSLVYLIAKYPTQAVGTTPRRDANFEELPGLPIVGNLFSQFLHSGHPLEWATAIALKHGPGWSFTLPGLRIIDISKPEWIEYVQKTNFSNYIKGSVFHEVMSDVFGDGIFVNDGDRWKSTRQCTSRIFHVNSFRNVIMPSLEQGLRSLCKTLHYKAEQDLDVDFCSIFYKFTLESFIKMTFGKDLNILEAETRSDPHSLSSSSIEFASAFDYAQNQLDWRFVVMTGWSILENVFSSKGNKMRAACKTLDNFVYALIDGKQIPDVSENPDNGHDLLELFMKAKDDTGRSLQRTELRDAVLNLIVAGRDTTAQALAWAFFHLIMNTHLIKRILEEIDELGEDVTYDNHKQYTWTQAVICEALRLHPSVPKNMKFAINSDRIPGGPIIQPGDAVRWGDWQMGRDSRIWGPDCGEFKAERWIDSEGKLKQVGQFKFHAFNGGPRLCLGMTLAMLQAVAVTVRILKNFHLEFAPGWLDGVSMSDPIPGVKTSYPTPRYKPSLTHPMDQPMLIRLRARAQS